MNENQRAHSYNFNMNQNGENMLFGSNDLSAMNKRQPENVGRFSLPSRELSSESIFTPYTFNPKTFLRKLEKSSGSFDDILNPFSLLNKKKLKSSLKRNDKPKRKRAVTFNFEDDDPIECKRTGDYKRYLKEFDKTFGSSQEETKRLSERVLEYKSLVEKLMEESKLSDSSTDSSMILLRSHIKHELNVISNNLKDLYCNLLIIMKDRDKIREQYCLLQTRNKFLKSTKQENDSL